MHTVASSSRPQHGVHTLARLGRGSNEDTFISAPITVEGAGGPVHVLAVFDGHSSASVSDMAAAELPQLMTQLISSALSSSSSAAAADVDAAMPQILQTACEQLDKRVQPLDNSGSTATVAVLTPKQLHLAWVGDSRGVLLGQGGRVLAFTQEHRATREDEQVRHKPRGRQALSMQSPCMGACIVAAATHVAQQLLRY
jgi:serine/threonine protein phosphatase PrpC